MGKLLVSAFTVLPEILVQINNNKIFIPGVQKLKPPNFFFCFVSFNSYAQQAPCTIHFLIYFHFTNGCPLLYSTWDFSQ